MDNAEKVLTGVFLAEFLLVGGLLGGVIYKLYKMDVLFL